MANVRRLIDSAGHSYIELQADGNVSFANIPVMIRNGATMLVGGTSSIFHERYSIGEAVAVVKNLIQTSSTACA